MNIEQMLAAIAIFRRYVGLEKYIFHAEHDVLWGPHEDEMENITEKDEKELEALGWNINSDGCWAHNCSC